MVTKYADVAKAAKGASLVLRATPRETAARRHPPRREGVRPLARAVLVRPHSAWGARARGGHPAPSRGAVVEVIAWASEAGARGGAARARRARSVLRAACAILCRHPHASAARGARSRLRCSAAFPRDRRAPVEIRCSPPRAPPSSRHPTPATADLLTKSFKYENKVEVKTTTPSGVTFTSEAVVSKPGE